MKEAASLKEAASPDDWGSKVEALWAETQKYRIPNAGNGREYDFRNAETLLGVDVSKYTEEEKIRLVFDALSKL